jgi:hypothetical protein
MTRITVPAGDRDGVRVFTARLTAEDLQRGKARLAADLLGDHDLDPAFVEIFDSADLSGVGLARYLTDGLGVPETALANDAHLAALKGPVLILLSKALHGREVTLTLDPRLTLVGTFAEDRPPVHFEPLPTAAARGHRSPRMPPDSTARRPILAFLLFGVALLSVSITALWLARG